MGSLPSLRQVAKNPLTSGAKWVWDNKEGIYKIGTIAPAVIIDDVISPVYRGFKKLGLSPFMKETGDGKWVWKEPTERDWIDHQSLFTQIPIRIAKDINDPDIQAAGITLGAIATGGASATAGTLLGVGFAGYQGYKTYEDPTGKNIVNLGVAVTPLGVEAGLRARGYFDPTKIPEFKKILDSLPETQLEAGEQ